MPSQERLVSIVLEGLLNKELHIALYMKHHKNLNHYIHDAINYDDNCIKELNNSIGKYQYWRVRFEVVRKFMLKMSIIEFI